MYEFLCIDTKTLNYGGFKFYQNGLVLRVLEATGVNNYDRLPTPTKVEALLKTDENDTEAKRDRKNPYISVIGIILYLSSNTI